MVTKYNRTLPAEFAKLALKTDSGKYSAPLATAAMNHSLFTVGIYDEDELIAFGRITGDGSLLYVVSDVMVDPDYESLGYEDRIMKEITDFFLEFAEDGSRMYVIGEKPLDESCLKMGFRYADPDAEVLMKR